MRFHRTSLLVLALAASACGTKPADRASSAHDSITTGAPAPSAPVAARTAPDAASPLPDTASRTNVEEHDGPPEYIFTRAEARNLVREYYRERLSDYAHNRKIAPAFKEMFERAMTGDPAALDTVFFNSAYHSGDEESWSFTALPLARAVGDERFAAWLRQHPQADRKYIFDEIFYNGSDYPESIANGYFARTLPQVAAIYGTDRGGDMSGE